MRAGGKHRHEQGGGHAVLDAGGISRLPERNKGQDEVSHMLWRALLDGYEGRRIAGAVWRGILILKKRRFPLINPTSGLRDRMSSQRRKHGRAGDGFPYRIFFAGSCWNIWRDRAMISGMSVVFRLAKHFWIMKCGADAEIQEWKKYACMMTVL